MNVLVAPDSFKGSLSAKAVADHIEFGILQAYPSAKIDKLPLADGGEGTVDALVYACNGKKISKMVTGPLGEQLNAHFGLLGGKTAVIEIAAASGLEHISPGDENPLKATTFGTGELIKAVLDEDIDTVIIGLGGSATTDAGMGMAQALGVSFKDEAGHELGFGGAELLRLATIDLSGLDRRIEKVKFIVASDVTNPLYGKNGAAHVFGPQKGATPELVRLLDDSLRNFAKVVQDHLGFDVNEISGAGAAGGLGAALSIFCNAKPESGIDIVLDYANFNQHLQQADLVITGEGKLDRQTLMGKAPYGVAKRAKDENRPVICIAGAVENSAAEELNKHFDAFFSITQEPVELENAKKHVGEWLEVTAAQVIRCHKLCNA